MSDTSSTVVMPKAAPESEGAMADDNSNTVGMLADIEVRLLPLICIQR
jgi:hypothetical protein